MRLLALLPVLIALGSVSKAEGPAPRRLWERRLVRAPAVAPFMHGDTLFVAGMDRKLLCLDARGGDRRWRRTMPGQVACGIVRADSCLLIGIGSPTPAVVAFECRNGHQRWSRRLDSAPVGIVRSGASIAVLEYGGIVRGIELRDGAEKWSRRLKGPMSGMAIDGTSLKILARRDSLWSLDLADGKRLWAAPVSGTHPAGPVIVEGGILRLTYEGELALHDGSTGVEIVRAAVPSPQIALPGVMGEGRCAVVATGGDACALALPGLGVVWSQSTGETVSAGAAPVGDFWVVACQSGRLMGLSPRDGTVAWTLELPDPVSLPPAVDGGTFGIVDERGRAAIYVLEEGS